MNRSGSAKQPLLDAFLSVGPEGATREDLIQLSGTSNTSFYRIITPLIEEGLIEDLGRHYRLVLAHRYNYRYKLWRDAARLRQLEVGTRQAVEDVVQETQKELAGNLEALWLMGSGSQQTLTPLSELCFLAVVQQESSFSPRCASLGGEFVTMAVSRFETKANAGDSFVLSALRFGLLLEDRGFAQAWLDAPQQVALNDHQIRCVQEELDELRSDLQVAIRIRSRRDSRHVLRSYAMTLGRALLAYFHELPARKLELLEGLSLYYGLNPVSEVLERLQDGQELNEVAEIRVLEEYWGVFVRARSRLDAAVNYPYHKGLQFSDRSGLLLTQALSSRGDLAKAPLERCYRICGKQVCFETESTFGKIRGESLERLSNRLRVMSDPDALGVLITNPQNKVRLSNRQFEIPAQVQALAKKLGLYILQSSELLRLHNQIQLTQQGREQLLTKLGLDPQKGLANVLRGGVD